MITRQDIECAKSSDFLLFEDNNIKLMYDFDTQYYSIYIDDIIFKAVKDIDLAATIYNNLLTH